MMGALTENLIRLLDRERVADLIGSSTSYVDYIERTDPTFPRRVKLSAAFNASKRWVESELHAWLRARVEARDLDLSRASQRGRALAAESLKHPRRGRPRNPDRAAA